jgi:transposase InsO family protein
MPWKDTTVVDLRAAFVYQVNVCHQSVAGTCRQFGISRKTGYKWLRRAAVDGLLTDRSRRPKFSPTSTSPEVEERLLQVRDQHGWGPRKIRAYLVNTQGLTLPSVRTVANILTRCGRIKSPELKLQASQFFERPLPNQLWQCDFKGPLEVERRRVFPFAAIDDHSRFAVALRACFDVSMASAWDALWDAFGEFGLPDAILCDNAFGSNVPHVPGVSWFESQLFRLGIQPIHGRPYHPQTQGKIERFNGTLERELWPHIRRDSLSHFDAGLIRWRAHVYNSTRPHEALGDLPPATRWRPSSRKRPPVLPCIEYPDGSDLRKVSSGGDVQWQKYRFLAGRGLGGQFVRFEERTHEIAIFYCGKEIRTVDKTALRYDCML